MSPLERQVFLQLPLLQDGHQHSEQDEAGKEHQALQAGVDHDVGGEPWEQLEDKEGYEPEEGEGRRRHGCRLKEIDV